MLADSDKERLTDGLILGLTDGLTLAEGLTDGLTLAEGLTDGLTLAEGLNEPEGLTEAEGLVDAEGDIEAEPAAAEPVYKSDISVDVKTLLNIARSSMLPHQTLPEPSRSLPIITSSFGPSVRELGIEPLSTVPATSLPSQ